MTAKLPCKSEGALFSFLTLFRKNRQTETSMVSNQDPFNPTAVCPLFFGKPLNGQLFGEGMDLGSLCLPGSVHRPAEVAADL